MNGQTEKLYAPILSYAGHNKVASDRLNWCNLNSPSYELSLDLGILFLCLQGFNIGSINAVFTLSVTWEHSFECPQNFLLRQTVINKTKADNVRQICHVKFTNQP
jgi:hypothetical protein